MSEPIQEGEILARQRAAVIVQVLSGQITAKEAAAQLGVSRKTYYQWERRAMAALVASVQDRPGGRPGRLRDAEKQDLQTQNAVLEEQVQALDQALEIHRRMRELFPESKKNSSDDPG
jgi:transposase